MYKFEYVQLYNRTVSCQIATPMLPNFYRILLNKIHYWCVSPITSSSIFHFNPPFYHPQLPQTRCPKKHQPPIHFHPVCSKRSSTLKQTQQQWSSTFLCFSTAFIVSQILWRSGLLVREARTGGHFFSFWHYVDDRKNVSFIWCLFHLSVARLCFIT